MRKAIERLLCRWRGREASAAGPRRHRWHDGASFDFLLVVNSASMESYHSFMREVALRANNVRNFESTFAMNYSKFEKRVSLSAA